MSSAGSILQYQRFRGLRRELPEKHDKHVSVAHNNKDIYNIFTKTNIFGVLTLGN
jgi:hypothetical protein